jgi:uncharacterized protein YecE (DUF72 family)
VVQVWIGTSGYSYLDWVGPFYPAGTRPNRMLAHYCQSFPLVELNFTFYRPPTASMLDRIAAQTPDGFQFLVKMPRTLSHDESPQDLPGFRMAVEALRRRGKLSGVLCQLPQATHRTQKHVAWLERLAHELGDLRLAVEFRHRSWAQADVTEWMRDRHLDLVSVDVPDLPNLYPRGLVQSSERIYIRLHSRNAANWYASGAERYDYNYGTQPLVEWTSALAQASARTEKAYVLFNNCADGHAPVNAQHMRSLIKELGAKAEIVQPFEATQGDEAQPLLFE